MMETAASDRPVRARQAAHDHLVAGWNCSQSVLLAVAETLDISLDGVLKAATGFGGGVGNTGSICGALAAGVLTLGLMNGRVSLAEHEEKEQTYLLCAAWRRRFVEAMGGSDCREILGVDLSDPAVRAKYWAEPGHRERCASLTVGEAARLLVAFIEESRAMAGTGSTLVPPPLS
jgi:C_GCAxxG_C_C family probable redox protein